jgi:hypothetical protein
MAVDGHSGELRLALGQRNCSSSVFREGLEQETVTVAKTSLDDFCQSQQIHRIDFLKLDIEGAELNVLEQMSDRLLAVTAQITVEFHDFLDRAHIPRIEGIVRRLKNLGFYFIRFTHHTWGDCLFLNQGQIPVGTLEKVHLLLRYKFAPGINRSVRRLLKRPARFPNP